VEAVPSGPEIVPQIYGGLYEDYTDILVLLDKMITKIQDKIKGENDG